MNNIILFNRIRNLSQHGCDIGITSSANGIRFTDRAGSTNVSELFKDKQKASAWLDGYVACLAGLRSLTTPSDNSPSS